MRRRFLAAGPYTAPLTGGTMGIVLTATTGGIHMASETAHHTIRSTTRTAPAPAAGTGVPLLALVLSGALRVRRDGEELNEPPSDAD